MTTYVAGPGRKEFSSDSFQIVAPKFAGQIQTQLKRRGTDDVLANVTISWNRFANLVFVCIPRISFNLLANDTLYMPLLDLKVLSLSQATNQLAGSISFLPTGVAPAANGYVFAVGGSGVPAQDNSLYFFPDETSVNNFVANSPIVFGVTNIRFIVKQ